MSPKCRQTLDAACVAACTTTRRRCLPPRPRVPVSMSLHQRWRERPRRRAQRLTQGALTGSFTPSLVCRVSLFASPVRAGEPARTLRGQVRPQKGAEVFRRNRFARGPCSPAERTRVLWRDRTVPTIAPMMLAPCSASSMLSASLRPGRWPGLRALTTPARGTHWQLRDGGHLMTVHNDVDASIARAYGGLISSVPSGTPPVRHNGIRSAHSADAPRARSRAHPSRHHSW
jgi:hypothetical protein